MPERPTDLPRADPGWIAEFAARYDAWLPAARPLLEAHRYGEAFKTYPFPGPFTGTPWSELTIPLDAVRLGIVTTAGVYRRGSDPPFEDTAEGDPRVVALPTATPPGELDVAHGHIPVELARADLGVVLPLAELRALVARGALGSLAPRAFSLVGYQTRAHDVATTMAPAIARAMVEDGVTLALVVPV
jgi:hypothetical protein